MTPARRPRLALVVTAPGDATDRLARVIVPTLAARLDAEILALSDYATVAATGTPSELFHELFCGAYDLVHAFDVRFAERVFDPAIAAEPALHDAGALADRLLKVPLTISAPDPETLAPSEARDRLLVLLTVICSGHVTTAPASWLAFFEGVLLQAHAGTGPMSEGAVWERSKAWSARVARVVTGAGALA